MNRALVLVLLTLSCSGKQGNADIEEDYTWPGGRFVFSTTGVEDPCGDGAFTAVLLPDGDGTTSEWQYSIEIPSWEDLESPQSYEIQLQDPFAPMEVTVRRGAAEGELSMAGGQQEDVLFDADSFDDCYVDMSITASIVLDDEDTLHGTAALSIIDSDGQTCPLFATPCDVILDFNGEAGAE